MWKLCISAQLFWMSTNFFGIPISLLSLKEMAPLMSSPSCPYKKDISTKKRKKQQNTWHFFMRVVFRLETSFEGTTLGTYFTRKFFCSHSTLFSLQDQVAGVDGISLKLRSAKSGVWDSPSSNPWWWREEEAGKEEAAVEEDEATLEEGNAG